MNQCDRPSPPRTSVHIAALSQWLVLCLAAVCATETHLYSKDVVPPGQADSWPLATPEESDLVRLARPQVFDFVRQHQVPVHSVQIARHGRLVLDAYFYPYRDGMRHDVASVTKSITSTLVGLAIQSGRVHDVKQPLLSFFPGQSVANLDDRK